MITKQLTTKLSADAHQAFSVACAKAGTTRSSQLAKLATGWLTKLAAKEGAK